MTFLLWMALVFVVICLGLFSWFMVVLTKIIFNIFLNLPIKAEPFRREEGILRYSVNLQTRDGVSIKGFFLPGKNTQGRTVVFCHEIGAGAASFQKYAYFLRERGFNVFTFDFRGHGLSGNSDRYVPRQWVTSYELKDLKAVFHYLESNNEVDPNRIGLFGVSKGGGTALIGAARHPKVKAVVSDGAFSTSYTVMEYIKKWIPIYVPVATLPYFVYWLLCRWATFTVAKKFRCYFPSLEKAIPQINQCALFLIHGKKDNYISAEQSQVLFQLAMGPKEQWIVPDARHNEAVKVAPDEYAERVSAFFEKYL